MNIDFANLKLAYKEHADEFDSAILEVNKSAHYIMGPKVKSLEETLQNFTRWL